MQRDKIIAKLDDILQPEQFDDYCPNGLQVEGTENIKSLVSAVSASQTLINKAVELKADAILVHHGLVWKGEDQRICGIKAKRLKALLENNINLIAYHLPLDAHPKFGNNAELARLLGITVSGNFTDIGSVPYAFYGKLPSPMTSMELHQKIQRTFQREPMVIAASTEDRISTVAWCSGAAQNLIDQAARLGVDAYISGEISEHTVHKARELKVDYFAIGHHASERYGVQALGKHLAQKFGIRHAYIELDNPV